MLIIALAYLYVIAIVSIVAIVDGHIASGVFTFLFAGLLPGFILIRIEIMKRRAARAKFEADTAPTDSTAAQTDQP
ncbi:hypothetical protein [Chitinimonas naiadis]